MGDMSTFILHHKVGDFEAVPFQGLCSDLLIMHALVALRFADAFLSVVVQFRFLIWFNCPFSYA